MALAVSTQGRLYSLPGFRHTFVEIRGGLGYLAAVARVCRGKLILALSPHMEDGVMEQGDELKLPPHLRRVADLLAEGKNNREMAEELSYTVHTIEKRVSELKRRLAARDRVDLVDRCRNWGAGSPGIRASSGQILTRLDRCNAFSRRRVGHCSVALRFEFASFCSMRPWRRRWGSLPVALCQRQHTMQFAGRTVPVAIGSGALPKGVPQQWTGSW